MIWGFITVLLMALALLFGAPFIGLLAPDENILLVSFNPETRKYHEIANGAETLWFQWQSWCYIFLFCLITALILGVIYNVIRTISDETLLKVEQELTQEKKELEKIKQEYQKRVEQDVIEKHGQEAKRLERKENKINTIRVQTENKEMALQDRIKMINNKALRQNQETQSKLGQRDRLRKEKKMIAEFLKKIDWKFADGTKITYNALARAAKKHRDH